MRLVQICALAFSRQSSVYPFGKLVVAGVRKNVFAEMVQGESTIGLGRRPHGYFSLLPLSVVDTAAPPFIAEVLTSKSPSIAHCGASRPDGSQAPSRLILCRLSLHLVAPLAIVPMDPSLP